MTTDTSFTELDRARLIGVIGGERTCTVTEGQDGDKRTHVLNGKDCDFLDKVFPKQ